MSKNIVEMINALNKQHKYAIADAVHNVDLVDDYDGVFEIITMDRLKEYFSEIGWNPGTYKRTISGNEYTFGSEDSYPLYTFPYGKLDIKGVNFKVEIPPTGSSVINFDFDSCVVNGAPQSITKHIVGTKGSGFREFYIFMSNKLVSCLAFGIPVLSYSGTPGILDSTLFTRETLHGKMDRVLQVSINNDGIGMINGVNYDKSKGLAAQKKKVQLTLGSATLDEAKLQALLALINQ